MMNKREFTGIAKRVLRSSQGIQNPRIAHPERDWAIGLLVAALLFVSVSVWSVQTYLTYRNIAISETKTGQSEVMVYREAMVGSVLQTFSDRAVEHQALIVQMQARAQSVSTGTSAADDMVSESDLPDGLMATSTIPISIEEVPPEVEIGAEEGLKLE